MDYCGAERRHGLGPCQAPAGRGTPHLGTGRCSWHGGSAPASVRAAARVQAEAQARQELARLDVEPVGNPLEALRTLAGQVVAWQQTCAGQVNKLTDVRYEGTLHGEQLRAEVGMYQDALRQAASVLTSLAKLNIDERLATISERKAAVLAAAFAESLARAALPPEQASVVRQDFANRLKVLAVQNEDDPGDGAISGVVVTHDRPGKSMIVSHETAKRP